MRQADDRTETGTEPHGTGAKLSPGNWVAIAAIVVTVLGWVLSVALAEHNRRIAGIETDQGRLVTAQAELATSQGRLEGDMNALNERLTAMDQRITERFNQMDQRFTERFDQMDQRFDRMEASIERLLQLHTRADRDTAPTARPRS